MRNQQPTLVYRISSRFMTFLILLLCVNGISRADISCPLDEVGSSSSSCLSGQCANISAPMSPCEPPSWVPGFLAGLFCPADGDGETVVVPRCANECPVPGGGCANDEVCQTNSLGEYPGSGNGLCIAAQQVPDIDSPAVLNPVPNCDDDETWVSDPRQLVSGGGQCQQTSQLQECCYQNDSASHDLLQTACRAGTPTSCPGNDRCSRSGYCYQLPDRGPGLTEPDLQRDPGRYPPQPGEVGG